jgi:HEAT repeat protein
VLRDVVLVSESPNDWRWKARRVLSRFGPRTVPALVEALRGGEDPTIRTFAADALARLGAEAHGAAEALRHVAGHDADASVRVAAVEALEAIAASGSPCSIRTLARRARPSQRVPGEPPG